jgi:gamma-glutamylcyclotransferase (GGCT)/AIG2-like uncharacterized protein YtfP
VASKNTVGNDTLEFAVKKSELKTVPAIALNSLSPIDSLFVYGTLLTGESRHSMLAPGRIVSIIPARVAGLLLDLGEHPGLLISAQTSSRVQGELIRFESLHLIIQALDAEEGPCFRRQLTNASWADGDRLLRKSRKTGAVSSAPPEDLANSSVVWRRASAPFVLAWVYAFTGDASSAPAISSGNWRDR